MDEIRLAKQFCKTAKVYGAESYIKGFSGHILSGKFESDPIKKFLRAIYEKWIISSRLEQKEP